MKIMQGFSLPDRKYFRHVCLKTVKHLLRLFSRLKAGQVEISPCKKDNIYARKSHYADKKYFLSTKWEK